MNQINWGLLNSQPGAMDHFQFGMQLGRDNRMRQDEKAQKNALAAYVTDQSDANLAALAPHRPEFVLQETRAKQQAATQAEERQLIGAALNGDPAARQKLAYINSDMYLKLDENQKKQVDGLMETIGQQAFSILQLPENQRGPALQQALAGLKQRGMNTDAFVLTGNPTQDLKSALAMTGKLDEWEKFAQPNYTPVGEGGLAGFQFGQPIQQGGQPQNFAPQAGLAKPQGEADYNALPPGTQYIAPDGSLRVKGGGVSNGTGGFRP